jgi:hypothetical protein
LGKIAFRFHARDLHLVLGPTTHGKPVHFLQEPGVQAFSFTFG